MTQKLRFLTGRWTGTEVDLPTGEALLLKQADVDQLDACRTRAALSVSALVIALPETELPCSTALCATSTGIHMRQVRLDETAALRTTQARPNEPFRIGTIWVALAGHDSEWSDEVVRFTPDDASDLSTPQAAATPAEWAPSQQVADDPTQDAATSVSTLAPRARTSGRGVGTYLGLTVLLGVSLSAGAYAWTSRAPSVSAIEQIGLRSGGSLLGGTTGPYYLVLPTDGQAIAATRELRQLRASHPAVKVMSSRGVAQQIEQFLDQQEIGYVALDVSRPDAPHIILSAERGALDTAAQDALSGALRQALPYVTRVTFSDMPDQALTDQAADQIRQAGFDYTVSRENGRSLITVHGLTAGSTLDSLERVIRQFQAQWGRTHVQFAVDLKPEPLHNKSFVTGARNYVIDSGQHLQFFNPNQLPATSYAGPSQQRSQ